MHTASQSSALLSHIVAQTQSNLDFLVSQNHLTASDVAGILSKLSTLQTGHGESPPSPVLSVAERTRQMSLMERENWVPERAPSPPKAVMPIRRVVPPPPTPILPRNPQAKALWDYNPDGTDPNDLSFRAGDIIEIVSETNVDWWTGKLNGRQGLFPSNYVEKLPDVRDAPASPGRAPIPVPAPTGSSYGRFPPSNEYQAPPPFPSGPSSYNAPPPPPPSWNGPPQPYNAYNEKPQPQQQVYAPAPAPVQAPPEPEKKKSKFGGLGTTMANSAAGGVGFGAGAAIGSGIINSIF